MFQKMGGLSSEWSLDPEFEYFGWDGPYILWILLKYGDGGDIGTFIYIYIWAAVKINCLCLVQKYKLSLFGGGPIVFQCFVQINMKYCKNAREVVSRIQI